MNKVFKKTAAVLMSVAMAFSAVPSSYAAVSSDTDATYSVQQKSSTAKLGSSSGSTVQTCTQISLGTTHLSDGILMQVATEHGLPTMAPLTRPQHSMPSISTPSGHTATLEVLSPLLRPWQALTDLLPKAEAADLMGVLEAQLLAEIFICRRAQPSTYMSAELVATRPIARPLRADGMAAAQAVKALAIMRARMLLAEAVVPIAQMAAEAGALMYPERHGAHTPVELAINSQI